MGTWEHQGANDLEPAHKREDVEPTAPKHDRGGDLAQRLDRSVAAILRSYTTANAKTQNDAAARALVARHPTTTRGPDGYAAWLLEAIHLGFIEKKIMVNAQLQELMDDKPVRTWEYDKDNKVDKQAEDRRKRATNGKLDNANRVPGKPKEWDIDLAETPILEPLVAVARTRINNWLTNGGDKVVLSLGDFVRADMWYDTGAKVPPHEPGTAMDLFFVGKVNGENDVLELLKDLPPRGTLEVFLDNDDALHLDVRPGGYGLGIPARGDFIPHDMAIEHDGRGVPVQNAESAASDHRGTIHAKGIKRFSGRVSNGTATWHDQKGEQPAGWVWTWKATDEGVVSHIRSERVRDAINNYNRKSR